MIELELPRVQSADCTTTATAQATAAADTSAEQSITFRISDIELPTIISEPAYHSYSSSQESGDSSDSELACANKSDDSTNSKPELLTSSSVNEPGSQNDSEPTEGVDAVIRLGDFGKVVKLKHAFRLTHQEKYLLLTQFNVARLTLTSFLLILSMGFVNIFSVAS